MYDVAQTSALKKRRRSMCGSARVVIGTMVIGCAAAIHGQEVKLSGADQGADAPLIAEVDKLTGELQRRCEFKAGNGRKFLAHPDPVLRWSNPTAGKVFGNVCIWTDGGRPVIIGCIYRFFSPNWGATFEVSSLSDQDVRGNLGQVEFWSPNRSGRNRQIVPAAEAPANSAPARLVQMRRLAGDFAAHLQDTRGNENGVPRELRLLRQPVYRYSSTNRNSSENESFDGAIFTFVEGTDPEVILILEARPRGEKSEWEYGLARMNRDALQVTYRGETVWSVPFLEQLDRNDEPYTLFSLEQPPLNQLSRTDRHLVE